MHDAVYKMVEEIVTYYITPRDSFEVLEISGERWDFDGNGVNYTRTVYPEFDICEKPMDRQFDLIIAEQVFEYLPRPYRAGCNVHAMLYEGGYFLISAPFLYPRHDYPMDCNRWSEMGLKYFLEECGFPIEGIKTDSWGNRDCIRALLDGRRNYQEGDSLENEPEFPVNVWAMARK